MSAHVSVIIPTHNPRLDHLQAALAGLQGQDLPLSEWEVIVVDNKSEPSLLERIDLSWHPQARVVREEKVGLTQARLAGCQQAIGDLLVLVDDDNVLASEYLGECVRIAKEWPCLGTWSGTINPRYELPALAPPSSLHPLLTLRSVSADCWSNDCNHHPSTPWGAGLCIRAAVAKRYCEELALTPIRRMLDLQGQRLLYGGDTDIAYTGCRMGLGKGVFARLVMEHLIPANRCSEEYLRRVALGRGYSEVFHHFALSGRIPPHGNSILTWLQLLRRGLKQSPLERRVWSAHRTGQRQAMIDLNSKSKPSK